VIESKSGGEYLDLREKRNRNLERTASWRASQFFIIVKFRSWRQL